MWDVAKLRHGRTQTQSRKEQNRHNKTANNNFNLQNLAVARKSVKVQELRNRHVKSVSWRLPSTKLAPARECHTETHLSVAAFCLSRSTGLHAQKQSLHRSDMYMTGKNLVEFPSCHSVTHEQLFAGTGSHVCEPIQSTSI